MLVAPDINRDLYRMFDSDNSKGCHKVNSFSEADKWNMDGWGIYWTVNDFADQPRTKENCVKINAWAIDLDDGSKAEQMERINKAPIQPSYIIESKNGYHIYFSAIDATIDNYRPIVERLVKFYGADENAKDVSRLLRCPYYFHWKDPQDKFFVQQVTPIGPGYTEKQIMKLFPEEKKIEQKKMFYNFRQNQQSPKSSDDLYHRLNGVDCEQALMRLSGSEAICGDVISFKRTTMGNLNILVNGKSTSCWIDRDKKIGSSDGGGPTIWNWVKWYYKDNKKTYELLKKHLPEIF